MTWSQSRVATVGATGWEFPESGTNANLTYTAGTGSGNAGDTYSFGAAGNVERAFGGIRSGTLVPLVREDGPPRHRSLDSPGSLGSGRVWFAPARVRLSASRRATHDQ